MFNAKPVCVPLGTHIKLSIGDCPKIDEEKKFMIRVSSSNAVGSLMYAMVCIRPDIAYVMRVVSRYMSNSDKAH